MNIKHFLANITLMVFLQIMNNIEMLIEATFGLEVFDIHFLTEKGQTHFVLHYCLEISFLRKS